MTEITLEFIGEQLKRLRADQRSAREERSTDRMAMQAMTAALHRIEQRITVLEASVGALRSDVTTAVRLEVSNAMLRYEDRLEQLEQQS